MHSFHIEDFPLRVKRSNEHEHDVKSAYRGGVFHVVREKDINRDPKKQNPLMYLYEVNELGSLRSAAEFRPSRGITHYVQDSVVKARREQHTIVKEWLNNLKKKARMSSALTDDVYGSMDLQSLVNTREWLSKKISYFVDGIGVSASQNSIAVYPLTEKGKLRTDVAQMLADRLGFPVSSYKLISLLRDDLWRAGLDQSIRGSWGTLNISGGELVIDTTAKTKIAQIAQESFGM